MLYVVPGNNLINWVTPVVRVTVVLVAAAVVVVTVAAAAAMFTFFLQDVFWGIQKVILVEFMFKEQAWS